MQTYSRHGLVVNFGTGRTEAVVRYAVAATKEATAAPCSIALVDDGGDSVPLLPLASGGALRLALHYRHLGGVVGRGYGLDCEVAARASAGHISIAALPKLCLRKAVLPTSARSLAAVA